MAGSNSYGAQARGSGCKSEVVFSDAPIDFPHVTTPDILVAMSQTTYDQYCMEVAAKGLILYDASLVSPRKGPAVRQVGVPATDTALHRLGNKQAANIVLLGSLIELTGLVASGAVIRAMEQHVGGRFQKLNLEAFIAGRELVSAAPPTEGVLNPNNCRSGSDMSGDDPQAGARTAPPVEGVLNPNG